MRPPDFTGPAGAAWELRIDPAHLAAKCTLAWYLLHVPGLHPGWNYWALSLIHMREVPGLPPLTHLYPEAAYELLVVALDPQRCPQPDPDHPPYPWLTPPDICEQFHGTNDAGAADLAMHWVDLVVRGKLPPDQDFRQLWHEEVKVHMMACLRGEGLESH